MMTDPAPVFADPIANGTPVSAHAREGASSRRRRAAWIVLRALFALLALAYVVVTTDFGPFQAAARRSTLYLGVAIWTLTIPLQAWRWQILLRALDVRVPLWPLVRYTWIGQFYNQCLPGSVSGDVVKGYYVVRHAARRARVATTLIVDRFVGLYAIILLCALAIVWRWDDPGYARLHIPVLAVTLGVLALGSLFFSHRLRDFLRLPVLVRRLPFSGVLKEIDGAVTAYRSHKTEAFFAFALSLALQAGGAMTGAYFLAEALGLAQVSWLDFLAVFSVIMFLSAIPIMPGFLGLAVYGKFLWGLVGLDAADAATMSALQGAVSLAFSLPGLPMFIRERAFSGHETASAPEVPAPAPEGAHE